MKKILQFVLLLLLLSPSLAYDDDNYDDDDEGNNKHKKWWSTPLIVVLYIGFFLLAAMVSLCIRHYRDRANIRNIHRREADRGLDAEEIESLPSLRFSEMKLKGLEKGNNEQLECAICLAEFKDQEVVRVLPDCYHVFHPSCIAPWLASHVTCPICRSSLEHKQGSSLSMSSILDGTSGSLSQRIDHSGSPHDHDHNHDHHSPHQVTVEIQDEGSSTLLSQENNLDDRGPGVISGTPKLPRPYSTGDLRVQMVENCSTSLSSLMPRESSPKSDYRTINAYNEAYNWMSCISSKSDRFVDYTSLTAEQLKSTVVSVSCETTSSET